MKNQSPAYNFFATTGDISQIFQTVEAVYLLQYVETGLFNESKRPAFHGFSSLPNLGLAQTGDSNLEPTFLVLQREDIFNVRTVPQLRGGNKYAIDQLANTGTVVIRPGGKYLDAAIIAGMVGTVHNDDKARTLIDAFFEALRRNFIKSNSYFLGPAAKKLHGLGMRLTTSISAPKKLDFLA